MLPEAMKNARLQDLTVKQLVERFVTVALAQYDAIEMDENAKYGRLYSAMEDVRRELKGRAGDQRRALLPLLNHANAQVRLKAAITLLAIAPARARGALQLIKDRKEFPQAADAFGMLRSLDAGTYVPK
jgi:hypothetical protein